MHPALLDAALHPSASASDTGDGRPPVPFAWSGVHRHRPGATAARVRPARRRRASGSTLADAVGDPVDSVAPRLRLRPASRGRRRWAAAASTGRRSTVPDTARPPSAVRLPADLAAGRRPRPRCRPPPAPRPPGRSAPLQARPIAPTRGHPARRGHPRRRRHRPRTSTDLAGAAVWGLVRAGQSEHPGRFVAGRRRRPGAGDGRRLACRGGSRRAAARHRCGRRRSPRVLHARRGERRRGRRLGRPAPC